MWKVSKLVKISYASWDQAIDEELTSDYWEIRLPRALDRSGGYSPSLFAYHAALVLINARPLFSRLTISELLDPSVRAHRTAVERHHLFPRAYLARIGITKTSERNQIANYAFVEWPDNAKIGDQEPAVYFPSMFDRLTAEEQRKARFWHALPDDWYALEYDEFLNKRRLLIAEVIRSAFRQLRTGELPFEDVVVASAPASPTLTQLLDGPRRWANRVQVLSLRELQTRSSRSGDLGDDRQNRGGLPERRRGAPC